MTKKEKKHILTIMIYMVELNSDNCNHIKKVFKGYEINIFEGSFLDYKNDINFDIIVGNPPYNQGGISSKKKY